ncbi:MAG: hypothetical protein ACT4P7_22295 [Gemmatimonadaceae bacterium]
MKRLVLFPVIACILAAPVERAGAQSASRNLGDVVRVPGPSRGAAIAGIRRLSTKATHEVGAVVQRSRGRAKPTTLMIVGGATFLGGLLIGDDVGTAIAVVGLGVGVYGLYLYYQ